MRDRHRKDSLEYYNLERKCKAEMDRINKLLKTLNREVKSKLHQPDQESDRLKSEITVVKDEIAEQVITVKNLEISNQFKGLSIAWKQWFLFETNCR